MHSHLLYRYSHDCVLTTAAFVIAPALSFPGPLEAKPSSPVFSRKLLLRKVTSHRITLLSPSNACRWKTSPSGHKSDSRASFAKKSFSCSNHVQPDSRDKEYTHRPLQLLVSPGHSDVLETSAASRSQAQTAFAVPLDAPPTAQPCP